MPHINVKLYPGKSEEMKENLANAVRKALAEESGVWCPEDISVSMEEIAPEKFEAETKASFKEEELLLDSKYINFK
jgi:4-oxalocrotonate tautomerase